jgi:hypothetical protein
VEVLARMAESFVSATKVMKEHIDYRELIYYTIMLPTLILTYKHLPPMLTTDLHNSGS